MYARLRGVPAGQINRLSARLVTRLGLEPHADKCVARIETSPSTRHVSSAPNKFSTITGSSIDCLAVFKSVQMHKSGIECSNLTSTSYIDLVSDPVGLQSPDTLFSRFPLFCRCLHSSAAVPRAGAPKMGQ